MNHFSNQIAMQTECQQMALAIMDLHNGCVGWSSPVAAWNHSGIPCLNYFPNQPLVCFPRKHSTILLHHNHVQCKALPFRWPRLMDHQHVRRYSDCTFSAHNNCVVRGLGIGYWYCLAEIVHGVSEVFLDVNSVWVQCWLLFKCQIHHLLCVLSTVGRFFAVLLFSRCPA